jgi:hypothetical protein
VTQDARAILDSVRDLAPTISSRSSEIESMRRLPADLLSRAGAALLGRDSALVL